MNAARPVRTLMAGERGDVSIQAVLIAPAVILLLGLAIVALRFYTAESAVKEAARSAARAASIASDGPTAAAAAENEARVVLGQQGLSCASVTVAVNANDFAKPIGETGFVVATVSCDVALSDLPVPGVGSKTATASFRSPIDRYGART